MIDPNQVGKHFNAKEAEKHWDEKWQEWQIYHYQPQKARNETFVVDTPPPTVSGSLHMGHIFSYTHTDIVVRHQRMRGKNIFYPMGWDDNGLPTERRVQALYHVRCDPAASYEKDLNLEPASAKQKKDRPRLISRPNFIELCHQVTKEDETTFQNLFRQLGLSVDWRLEYATINEHCRKIAQLSFIDLFQQGEVYNTQTPTMWDVDFQTAVAQAEVEDREIEGAFHHIRFGVLDSPDTSFEIATTRPELLPACVGITAHPNDERYKNLFGKKAVVPLFHLEVPIFPSEAVDPDKGTGILMVCTFGDTTDIEWWREHSLETRQVIEKNGRFREIDFHKSPWKSQQPERAQRFYSELEGKNVKQAQKKIVELLRSPEGAAVNREAPLTKEPVPIQHSVKFFEKGDRPLELITTRQWFVRLMDKKEALIQKGEEIKWHPDFMRSRYRNWTENLQLDWCISRQRYFGVPFPLWYPLDQQGQRDYSNPLLPTGEDLPIDPTAACPRGYEESQRDQPGGFTAETDVFDTWFTSSMSPQIGSFWTLDLRRHQQLFPADVRPQGHDIIRTWAFYTIAKALLHENKPPWKHALISGWVTDANRKKMSKSKGNVQGPEELLEKYSADAARYWAGSARLGADTVFDEQVLKVGQRLTTKIFNASKFVLSQTSDPGEISHPLDQAFQAKLQALVTQVTQSFGHFNYAQALHETERFFWTCFTDTYLELAKHRAKTSAQKQDQISAVNSLRRGLHVLLRLFAPTLPYVTEEVWSWVFAKQNKNLSIHKSPWPQAQEWPSHEIGKNEIFDSAIEVFSQINRIRTELRSKQKPIPEDFHLEMTGPKTLYNELKSTGVINDICSATKATSISFATECRREELNITMRSSS